MSTSTILPIRPQVQSESDDTAGVWLDWSEAASPAVLRAPRTQLPAYVYRGLTGSHWDGQRCDLVAPDDAERGLHTVIFGCGCVGRVPLLSLSRR